MSEGRHVMRPGTASAVLVTLALLLSACGSGSGSSGNGDSNGLKEVSLRLDWVAGSEHSPYVVALEEGYFEQAGLDVTIREGEGSSVTAKLVANGNDTFGIVSAGLVVASVSQGLPIRAVATPFKSTGTAILSPGDQPVNELTDLYGKDLGVDVKSIVYQEYKAVASLNNIDTSQINEVGISDTSVALLTGRVDAVVGVAHNEGVELETKGMDVNYLFASDLGLNVPGWAIVANTETINSDPEMVNGFVDAVMKGWEFSLDKPDEALTIFLNAYPDVDRDYATAAFPIVLILIGAPEGQPLGYSDLEAWNQLTDLYLKAEILEEDLDRSELFTNEFVTN